MVGAFWERRPVRRVAEAIAASVCAYLAWLAMFLILDQFPRLLLAAVTRIQVIAFDPSLVIPNWQTRLPDRAARNLFSFYFTSVPIWGLLLLSVGPAVSRRLRGWPGIFAAQATLIVAWRVTIYVAFIASAGWFHPFLPAPFNGSAWAGSRGFRLVLGASLTIWNLYLVGKVFNRLPELAVGTRRERIGDFAMRILIPLGIVGVIVALNAPPRGGFPDWISVATALGFMLAAAFPACARSSEAARTNPNLGGAVRLAGCLAIVLGLLLGYGALRDSRRRNEHMSEFGISHTTSATLYIQKSLLEVKSLEQWESEEADRRSLIAKRLGITAGDPSCSEYLYRSADLKRAVTGSDEPCTLRAEKNEIHILKDAAEDTRGLALFAMLRNWGTPSSEAVAQALARYSIGEFFGWSLEEYAAHIVREQGPFSLREILGLDAGFFCPIVRDVLGGFWITSLAGRCGLAVLEKIYFAPLAPGKEEAFARILGSSWSDLERDWYSSQARLSEMPLTPFEPQSRQLFYQLGMTLTQRGYATGYGSGLAAEQLAHLRADGVNTITLVPFAGTRAPKDPGIFPYEDSRDDRIIRTLRDAQRIGLRLVLKPHLSAGDEFVGNISFDDPTQFQAWFDNYRRWLLHYARIAQLFRVDSLVIGTELAGVTRNEAAWRLLIHEVRQVYSGPLTYAAHWGKDFEELRFWDALDYIGVNMYYPLADPGQEPRPDSQRIRRLVEMFASVARRFGKPVVFTEVGFPNTNLAAEAPFRRTNYPLNLELQARCVRTVLDAFGDEEWQGGMNWWEWPTTGQSGSLYETFILSGNPAADVILKWYTAKAAR